MKKVKIFVWCCFLVICVPSRIFGWGAATHAYFAGELADSYGVVYQQEMVYGSMLPDMYNFMYGSDYKDYLWNQSHFDFMKIMDKADGMQQKALAYGFMSHNDEWGADYTSHHDGRTTPGKGYAVSKAEDLLPEFKPILTDILTDSGVPDALARLFTAGLAPELTEIFVETAVDILIKRNEDPEIGTRILQSTQLPDFEISALLNAAFTSDFAKEFDLSVNLAETIIVGAEIEFKEFLIFYGDILIRDEDEAIELLMILAANLAETSLKALTGYDASISPEVLSEFLRNYTLPLLEEDYSSEVSATLEYLEEQFLPMGVEEEKSLVTVSLFNRNYPNPFNLSTTIKFSLPETGFVDFIIYNLAGQKVRILISETMTEGIHSIVWDSRDDSGIPVSAGVYVTRLKMGDAVKTGRMTLVK